MVRQNRHLQALNEHLRALNGTRQALGAILNQGSTAAGRQREEAQEEASMVEEEAANAAKNKGTLLFKLPQRIPEPMSACSSAADQKLQKPTEFLKNSEDRTPKGRCRAGMCAG